MTQEILNVVVLDDAEHTLEDVTPEYRALLEHAKAQVHGLMLSVFCAAENKMGADKLAMTILGQLYANFLHMVDGAEARQAVAEDVTNLLANITAQVERVETLNEGGSRA